MTRAGPLDNKSTWAGNPDDIREFDSTATRRRAHSGRPARGRGKITLGALVLMCLFSLAGAVIISLVRGSGSSMTLPMSTASASTTGVPRASVMVHIHGSVARSGLYEVAAGSRVIDAVMAAGGFLENADQSGVNLARTVSDGEQLWVPAVGEQTGSATDGETPGSTSRLVNLNTATVEQLDALPRVGPSLAARIVQWREKNGRFASVDDLLDVEGFGEKTVSSLRDLVTV